MFDRLLSSRRAMWTTFAATGALFLVLAVLLGVQMALGRDPSMGDRAGNRPSPGKGSSHALVPQQQTPQQQIPPQGYGDGDGRGQGYDDGSGYGYPQEQVPQQQQQAPQQQGPPLQSGTS